MRNTLTLCGRELASYFLSPLAYITITVFLIVTGLNFWKLSVESLGGSIPFATLLFGPALFWIMLLVVITVITMRLFAEEKRNGTIELLMTAPVRDTEVVMGKFLAAILFLVAACAPTAAYPLVLRALSTGVAELDHGQMATGYVGLALIAAFYVSIGLFVSSLTKSQVVAAMLTFAVLCTVFFIEHFHYMIPGRAAAQPVVDYVSTVQQVLDFSRGILDTRAVVLYVSGTVYMLFATVKIMESRRWM